MQSRRADVYLEIDRRDIRRTRIAESPRSEVLGPGQVRMKLERAALTSNNVSYALSGDMLDYWGFFPAEAGWGRLPVMGFGVVTESKHADVAVGGRYFGFFPLGDFHVVNASPSKSGFVDASPWREKHAMAYRSFEHAQPTAQDDAILILRGLFLTSFLLEDFLREHGNFGARQVIITSASSKTSIALAHCVRRFSELSVIGATSEKNLDFVTDVDEYDLVVAYDRLETIAREPSVVVDMAGNPAVISKVHGLLKNLVMYSCSVGATHWDAERGGVHIPPPRPEFFFAPSQLAKRGKEWGRDELNRRIDEALRVFVDDSSRWMSIHPTNGINAAQSLYAELVAGRVAPNLGNIVTFN